MANIVSNLVSSAVSVSVLVFCLSPAIFCCSNLRKLYLPDAGPESFAFDLGGGGPYTTVADGRILKYEGSVIGFIQYAFTAPNRPANFCDGANRTDLASICGRGLGLGFYYKTGELFVVDAAYGLEVVARGGGLAKQLATSAEGVPFAFPDGLEVDQETGIVYFTDASAVYNISQIPEFVANRDSTGRLLKYDPKTKNVTVLLSGLGGASGVAISQDGSFLLLTEFINNRVQKYWLKGPLANTAQVLVNLSGSPDKIKRNPAGDFWIAVTVQIQYPRPTTLLQGQRINGNGILLEKLTFSPEFNSSLITEVNEFRSKLYLGSLYSGYVGVYDLSGLR